MSEITTIVVAQMLEAPLGAVHSEPMFTVGVLQVDTALQPFEIGELVPAMS